MSESSAASKPSFLTPTAVAHAAFVPTGIMTVILGPLLPVLTARSSLTDEQAGNFFTAQFLTSAGGVLLSGVLVPRIGYRVVLVVGLVFMAAGAGTLLLGSWLTGIASVACWGVGLGLTIPTANLLVGEVHPTRRAAALNLLNFSWSAGAVACPFLLAPFLHRPATFLYGLGGFILLLAIFLSTVALPPPQATEKQMGSAPAVLQLMWTPAALPLAALFFLYVGTENAVGGWLASYAKRITEGGAAWETTPSFFYGALLVGRAGASVVLRRVPEVRFAQVGLVTAALGLVALLFSREMPGVRAGAVLAGLGLSAVYPITIALLSQIFGAAATRMGGIMFTLASLGGASVPWLVGFTSTRVASLKIGLAVPLAGCVLLLGLYLGSWYTRPKL